MVPEHHEYELAINAYRRPGELSILFSGYGRPEGGHTIGPAVHDYYLIHTVYAGSGWFTCKGRQYKCKTGDTFVIVPGELFTYEADKIDPWTYTWAGFSGSMAGDMLRTIGVTAERPVVAGADERIRGYYESMRKALQSEDSHRLADLACSGY
ncbi:MAG: AraC family ligand binding domain-containing protein, partial [Cohnella sp.]|nr:AraC family ligand binding domain-containing protein [Cohnella sp.]